jgi:hypothetical protein
VGRVQRRRRYISFFRAFQPAIFSYEVLSVCPSDLAVFPVEGLGWTDLGEPERVLSALNLKLEPVRSKSTSQRATR